MEIEPVFQFIPVMIKGTFMVPIILSCFSFLLFSYISLLVLLLKVFQKLTIYRMNKEFFLYRKIKNINEDIVYSMKHEEVDRVVSVTCDELGQVPIILVKNQEYEVFSVASTFFLKINKRLMSNIQYYITIKVFDKQNIAQDWKVSCRLPGKSCFSIFQFML